MNKHNPNNSVLFKLTGLILVALFFFQFSAEGKGERKYALGLNVNSNSYFIGGLDFAMKNLGGGSRYFLLEAVNVKHPNEVRWASGFNGTNVLGNKPFILGKTNYLFALRGQMGNAFMLFKKDEHNGVEVNLNMAGGLSLGIVKPYYIRYQYNSEQTETEQYTAGIHQPQNILGSAGPIYRFEESDIVPGVNARVSLEFEYGSRKKFRTMIETGFLAEYYAKPILIIDGAPSNSFFASAFVVLYVGKN